MTEPPLYWIREIQSTLIDARLIPMSGFTPDFPWETFCEKMASLLQTPGLRIAPRKTQFLRGSEILSGLGASPLPIALELTPLGSQAFWVMGKEDVAKLTSLALIPSNGSRGFSSQKFQEGFYYYLATLAAGIIDELQAFQDLGIKIGKPGVVPEEEALCIDVEIEHPKRSFWGRLICPSSLHAALKTHFSRATAPPLSSALAKQLEVTLRLELGSTHLLLADWKRVKVGDCLILDRCTYDPELHKGTAQVVLEQTPLLRARIREQELKIVDYALYREEQNPMHPHTPEGEENAEEFSSSTFEEETPEEEGHLWSEQPQSAEKMISALEIPMTLTVEVARLAISLEKLLQLTPGNVLELPVKPEQGVDIVASGKKIAKAELVKLGEMLAVKILQIGDHG